LHFPDEPTQAPFEQVCPDGHTWPHAPQFDAFEATTTHAPEQLT
jgi:hypothetical protein